MITQEESIQMAREVGALEFEEDVWLEIKPDQLTALCNLVRRRTLLEAAEWFEDRRGYEVVLKIETVAELRRMAGETNV